MKLIGLSGAIASGKTTVANILSKQHSTAVIFTDELAREAVAPGSPALQLIIENFGTEYLLPDGHLNRKQMGNLVFGNREAKLLLETITHPYITNLLASQITMLDSNEFIIIENAILFETGQYKGMDGFVLVNVDPDIQINRLMKRNNLTRFEAEQRIMSQIDIDDKIMLATELGKPVIIIDNNFNDENELANNVIGVWKSFTETL